MDEPRTPKLRAILLLALADVCTTLTLIHSGRAAEFNPFMATLLSTHPAVFAAVKLFATSGLALYLMNRAKGTKLGEATITAILVFMICVVAWNTFWMITA